MEPNNTDKPAESISQIESDKSTKSDEQTESTGLIQKIIDERDKKLKLRFVSVIADFIQEFHKDIVNIIVNSVKTFKSQAPVYIFTSTSFYKGLPQTFLFGINDFDDKYKTNINKLLGTNLFIELKKHLHKTDNSINLELLVRDMTSDVQLNKSQNTAIQDNYNTNTDNSIKTNNTYATYIIIATWEKNKTDKNVDKS